VTVDQPQQSHQLQFSRPWTQLSVLDVSEASPPGRDGVI
jgi:hypothetical protein